jgi:hypothetical protein
VNVGEKLLKRLRLIKKIAGHEARLAQARHEIAERWNGKPPDDIEWRVENIDKMMPDRHKRETSREIAVLLGEVEGRLMVDYAIIGEKVRKGASDGGKRTAKWKDRAPEMQSVINEIYAKHPKWTYEDIKRHAKKIQGYPLSALKRYTNNPKK